MSNVFKGKGLLGIILISLSLVAIILFSPNNAWADDDKVKLTDDLAVHTDTYGISFS